MALLGRKSQPSFDSLSGISVKEGLCPKKVIALMSSGISSIISANELSVALW